MGGTFARDVLCAFVAQSRHVDASEEMLPRTEQDRTHGKMQLVNQAGAQVLSNSGYAATEANGAAARCSRRLLQGGVDAFGDKAKLRTSRHPERRARMIRQHEDGRVIRRLVAPSALPALVRPRTSRSGIAPRGACSPARLAAQGRCVSVSNDLLDLNAPPRLLDLRRS
jgi:hypothetical protein